MAISLAGAEKHGEMPSNASRQVMTLFEGPGPKIVFCLPGNDFNTRFLACWSQLLADCQKREYFIMMSTGTGFSALMARANCLCVHPNAPGAIGEKPFHGIEHDYIMWIDSDQIFTSADFFKLMESPHNVTCGSYVSAPGGNLIACEHLDQKQCRETSEAFVTARQRLDLLAAHLRDGSSQYLPLQFAGMGFFLMKSGLLEKLQPPWFFPDNLCPYVGHSVLAGEDVLLCHKIRFQCKTTLMLDVRVHVEHLKLQSIK